MCYASAISHTLTVSLFFNIIPYCLNCILTAVFCNKVWTELD